MKKNTVFAVIIGILVLASLVMSVMTFVKLAPAKWECIAEECAEFVRGEEWVEQNCAYEEGEMICRFQLDGESYRVPLSGIDNVSKMVSCARYECASKVLISRNNQK